MGDYYFPALINPSIGIEPIPPPLSGSMLPLHQEVIYMAYLYNDGATNHRALIIVSIATTSLLVPMKGFEPSN